MDGTTGGRYQESYATRGYVKGNIHKMIVQQTMLYGWLQEEEYVWAIIIGSCQIGKD